MIALDGAIEFPAALFGAHSLPHGAHIFFTTPQLVRDINRFLAGVVVPDFRGKRHFHSLEKGRSWGAPAKVRRKQPFRVTHGNGRAHCPTKGPSPAPERLLQGGNSKPVRPAVGAGGTQKQTQMETYAAARKPLPRGAP